PGINRSHTRRLLHKDPKSGEAATFASAARRWLSLDFDHAPAPPLTDVVTDPLTPIQHLAGLLPPEFRDISFWFQFTSSPGLPGSEGFLSARFWYWAPRPYGDDELTRWGKFINRAADTQLIDVAVFRAVQPIYVASPLFFGMADPLPQRSGFCKGLEDELELILPPAHPNHPDSIAEQGYEPGLGVAAYLANIGGPDGYRGPIFKAIAAFVATYGSKADPKELYRDIRAALDRAEPNWRDDPKGLK